MSRNTKKRSQQKIIVLSHFFRKQIWIELALIAALTVATSVFSQQDFAQAQRSEPAAVSASTFQLHHVTLSVRDVDQVSQWYVETLGFTISDRFTLTRPDGTTLQIARVEIPGLRMNIAQFEGSVAPERTEERQGWRHLAFQVDNVDQIYQRLREKGVELLGEPFTYDPPGYRVAFFQDPEGNIIELYQEFLEGRKANSSM
jgi:catechol 2,3-dioxygenase-like lactoylglutathione lyase family enzyme